MVKVWNSKWLTAMLLLGVACRPAGPALRPGTVGLQLATGEPSVFWHGPDPGGAITVREGGCSGPEVRVALWTPGLVTPGGRAVSATVSPASGEGEYWLSIPVVTGLGDGGAVLWWSPQAGLARLPLGGRPGELEQTFAVTEQVDETALEPSLEAVAREADIWSEGAFLLQDPAVGNVGAIQLAGAESPPMVGVWDELWLTDGMVRALRADDGGDLLLQFAAQPRVEAEDALLRLNVPTRRVVVPAAPNPSPLDRWMEAHAGAVEESQQVVAIEQAIQRADAVELAWVEEYGRKLVAAAQMPQGCQQPEQVDASWPLLLTGYSVEVRMLEDRRCAVRFEPNPLQHRRRFRGWVGPEGVMPTEEWPVEP